MFEFEDGNGDGTFSGARSVSAKKPPSMCGSRFREMIMDLRWAGGGVFGEGVKDGWIAIL